MARDLLLESFQATNFFFCHGEFRLNDIDDSECLAEFRFDKRDIPVLQGSSINVANSNRKNLKV